MKIANPPVVDNECKAPQHADPRVRRTRKLLEDSFRALIAQKSFTSLSVQDIADHATVNRATFYAHYTDKHDLAASVLRTDLRNSVLQSFTERPAFTPENLTEIAKAVFAFTESMYDACPSTASEMGGVVNDTLQEEFYNIVEHWLSISKSYLRLFPGCSKATVATVISWSIYGGALRWIRSPHREPAEQVCREIVSILLPTAMGR